jgi:hypothetical protein
MIFSGVMRSQARNESISSAFMAIARPRRCPSTISLVSRLYQPGQPDIPKRANSI